MCVKFEKGGIETLAITEAFGEFRWDFVYELLLFLLKLEKHWFAFTQHLNFYIVPFLHSGLGKHSLHILSVFLLRFLSQLSCVTDLKFMCHNNKLDSILLSFADYVSWWFADGFGSYLPKWREGMERLLTLILKELCILLSAFFTLTSDWNI